MLTAWITLFAGLTAVHASAGTTERAIFGADDRQDYHELKDPLARQTVDATAVMVYGASLQWDPLQEQFELKGPTHAERYGLCPDVRFASQPSGGLCSGFLIERDVLVTAGHCMRWQHDCENNNWIFGYASTAPGKIRTRFELRDIYWCKQVLAQEYDKKTRLDFAVIQLDRPVEGRVPLKPRHEGETEVGEPVALAGYPGGLPAKWVGEARVTGSDHTNTFLASVDAFGGNSGSAVINARTGEVEGILIAGGGHEDWASDPELGCNRPRIYEETSGRGIEIEKIRVIEKDRMEAKSQ